MKLIMDQVKITGSSTGGMKITQECVNFIARKNIILKTKFICSKADLKTATEELKKGNDSGVRFVIDIEKTLADGLIN